jgi:hypothetical protein
MKANKRSLKEVSLGIFFIGMGILLFSGTLSLFPEIFLVLAACTIPGLITKGRFLKSLKEFIWMIGIYLVFQFNFSLPILFILLGVQVFVSMFGNKR